MNLAQHRRLWTAGIVGLALLFALTGLSSVATAHAQARTGSPLFEPISLTTSISTADATWVTVPMGHLNDPLNTFWQLFVLPKGGHRWLIPTSIGVATNGGLVLASDGGNSLLVGTRPANHLTFSPLATTENSGVSWNAGLAIPELAIAPSALAVDAAGEKMALVGENRFMKVIVNSRGSTSWNTSVTEGSIASSSAGRTCGVSAITAVAFDSLDNPVIGANCTHQNHTGLFSQHNGIWELVATHLPRWLSQGAVEVMRLASTRANLTTLLSVKTSARTALVATWLSSWSKQWTVSPTLSVPQYDSVKSYGPTIGSGMFVLLADASGREKLEIDDGPGASWKLLPTPPSNTVTAAMESSGKVEIFTVHGNDFEVWHLAPSLNRWTIGQRILVQIEYGSSG